jgi:hypothetical protein
MARSSQAKAWHQPSKAVPNLMRQHIDCSDEIRPPAERNAKKFNHLREESQNGKGGTIQNLVNFWPLGCQKSCKVDISSDVVGVTGLEPATSRPPAVRASQLRHTPILNILI